MEVEIHGPLLRWYDNERRALPWRGRTDPYAVWVSEVMLQQTQVATAVPYYNRWMARFPTVEALAAADAQEALALWQGLGYYRRCRQLHAGAQFVAGKGLPTTAGGWREVPGIGRYTAGAIASIAQAQPTPAVDGNVIRVYARLMGSTLSGGALEKAAWSWAESVLHEARPGDWNQALMELGALVCRPSNTACSICPLASHCMAKAAGVQHTLPIKSPRVSKVHLQETLWVPYRSGRVGVSQIAKGEWWEFLWEFPRVRFPSGKDELLAVAGPGETEYLGTHRYQVTRHQISQKIFLHRAHDWAESLTWIPIQDIEHIPMPAPQRRALNLAQVQGNLEG